MGLTGRDAGRPFFCVDIGQTPERNCAKLPNGESELLIVKMLNEGFAIARPFVCGWDEGIKMAFVFVENSAF